MDTPDLENPNMENYDRASELESDSTRRFEIFLNATFCVVVAAILYSCYIICTAPIEWGFKIDWNCFHSELTYGTCCVIGFFLQFLMKGGWLHTSTEEYVGYKDPHTGKVEKWEKNNDVLTVLFNSVVWPLVMHLILIPLAYGAAIWYTIAGIIALVGKLTPYIICLLLCGLCAWLYAVVKRNSNSSKRYVWLIASSLFCFTVCGATYFVMNADFSHEDNENISYEYIIVNADNVNLRLGPGTDYDKYSSTVSSGQNLQLIGEEGDWFKVFYEGNELWINNKFADFPAVGEQFHEEINCETYEDDVEEIVADNQPEEVEAVEIISEAPAQIDYSVESETETEIINDSPIAQERVWNNPQVGSINSGAHLDRVYIGEKTTSLYVSFVKNFSGPWNINRDAYITCDAVPDKKYYITGVKGTELSPKPCTSHSQGQKVEFVMFFDPVPLNSTEITLWEGPASDNFHIKNISVPLQSAE